MQAKLFLFSVKKYWWR